MIMPVRPNENKIYDKCNMYVSHWTFQSRTPVYHRYADIIYESYELPIIHFSLHSKSSFTDVRRRFETFELDVEK